MVADGGEIIALGRHRGQLLPALSKVLQVKRKEVVCGIRVMKSHVWSSFLTPFTDPILLLEPPVAANSVDDVVDQLHLHPGKTHGEVDMIRHSWPGVGQAVEHLHRLQLGELVPPAPPSPYQQHLRRLSRHASVQQEDLLIVRKTLEGRGREEEEKKLLRGAVQVRPPQDYVQVLNGQELGRVVQLGEVRGHEPHHLLLGVLTQQAVGPLAQDVGLVPVLVRQSGDDAVSADLGQAVDATVLSSATIGIPEQFNVNSIWHKFAANYKDDFLSVGSILVEEVVVSTSFLHRVVARTGP